MTYLVTGGGGFIGSHLVRELVQRGEHVRVLENGFGGTRARIADVIDDVEWLDGDIRDSDMILRACKDVEVVLHQAAVSSVPRSISEPELTHAVNVTGTLAVLLAARACGVRRVVFASSAAIYGDNPILPQTEDLQACPTSPYGAQKLAAETYCQIWNKVYGLETVALRYFNVFGPQQDPHSEYASVIPRFIMAALAGQRPIIYGDGEQSRDFIYISNVVAVNLLAALTPGAVGKVINVGTASKVTLNMILAEIGDILGHDLHPVYQLARDGDIRDSLANIGQLRSTLGYEPMVSLAKGLAQTVQFYQTLQL